jgi:hypothetical protein
MLFPAFHDITLHTCPELNPTVMVIRYQTGKGLEAGNGDRTEPMPSTRHPSEICARWGWAPHLGLEPRHPTLVVPARIQGSKIQIGCRTRRGWAQIAAGPFGARCGMGFGERFDSWPKVLATMCRRLECTSLLSEIVDCLHQAWVSTLKGIERRVRRCRRETGIRGRKRSTVFA